jgi:PAS domain S-box-containing protein
LLAVIDVTKQHFALEQNMEKEKRFQTLFNQSAVGIAIAEPDGEFITVNKRFAGILGYKPEELEDVNYRDITHPEDLEIDENLNKEMITGQRDTFEFEKRYMHKNGQPVWVRLYSSMVRDDLGNSLYGIVSMVDASEQKILQIQQLDDNQQLEEQNLLISEEFRIQDVVMKRLEQAEQLGCFGTFEFNIVRDIAWWSQNQYKLHGFKPNEVEPGIEAHFKCIHTEDREESEDCFKEIINSDVLYGSLNYRLIDNQQNLHYIHTEYSVERDEEGKALRISGIDQDVTERMLYEKQLFDSKENYRLLSDTSQNIILSHDISGKITYANDFCLAYFGITQEEMIGISIDMFLSEMDKVERKKILQDRFLMGDYSLHKSEMAFSNSFGENRILEILAKPIIKNDKPTGVLIVANDITDRKAAEKELLEHKEQLEKLVKQRTIKFEEQNAELQRFNKLFVGREFRIKELRDQVKGLQAQLGINER